jgi:hypothetical protein
MFACGLRPHIRSSFEEGYNKGIHSTDDKGRTKKRKLIEAQATHHPAADTEEKDRTRTNFIRSWNGVYPDSPVRDGDMHF